MKINKIYIIIFAFFGLFSCQDIVDDINDNDPNTISTVNGKDLFIGMQLADISANSAYLSWVSGVWSGYFTGSGRFEPMQNYQYGDVNSNTPWANIYQGVVKQATELRSGIPLSNSSFYFGASKVLQAHAIGTASNLFGAVPYSQAADDDIANPAYDDQATVYASLQTLLNEAISDLAAAGTSGGISEDILFGGDASKWIAAANTLKARLFLDVSDYSSALAAAQAGISSTSETMAYHPPAIVGTGDINLLFSLITSAFGPDLGVEGSFLKALIGDGSQSRNNGKTNEVDRTAFYYVADGSTVNTEGIGAESAPNTQLSYEENLLIWAEAAIRIGAGGFSDALNKLNEHRANLRDGVYFPITDGIYEDYIEADFNSGGVENVDGSLSKENALLREILEERYITFFAQVLGFNDMRRTKSDPTSVQVPVPLNVGTVHPERLLYPFTERNTNSNIPAVNDIFAKTAINQ